MGITIIHLSDSHFTDGSQNPLLQRASKLCGAIRSIAEPTDECVIIFSGDVANFGRPQDYTSASTFLKIVRSEIFQHINKEPIFVIVPGNHDHDFSTPDFDERMRSIIIEDSSPSKPPSKAMDEQLFESQKPFNNFIQRISSEIKCYAPSALFDSFEIPFHAAKIRLYLLNSTRFTKKNEVPGTSWFPTKELFDLFRSNDDDGGSINICVLHHPYNWNRPDNAKDMKHLLESRCDIIFTGHEHNPDMFKRTRRPTEQNLYVEGGVLQDPDNSNNSSFNIIKLMSETQTFLCTTFSWNDSIYEQITEQYEHKYLRLRQPLMNDFDLNGPWSDWLEEVGTDFRHPRERVLKLSDLFIYPDLQKLDIRKACSPMGIVHDRDVVGYIQEKKRIFIAGAEKTGKTSFSKQLFNDLRIAGFAPLLIRADFAVPSKDKHLEDSTRIRNAVNKIVEKIYTADSTKCFWQTSIKDRAIIIDDYNRISLGDGGRDKLVRWLDNNFGLVVLISSPGHRMSEILHKTEQESILWTFEHVDITECDGESRFTLVEKWLLLGRDGYQIDTDALSREKLQYCRIIDGLIDNGALPSLPMFIIMMMQQLEAGVVVDGTTGMYGTLYELIIRDVIKGAAINPADLEVKLNYLSEFAYALYGSGHRALTNDQYIKWHAEYCDTFNIRLNVERMITDFNNIGVFNKCGTDIGFKYSYYYCFFLARSLAHNIHESSIFSIVEYLCSALHNNDFANTMLFLCHQSKDPRVLDLIVSTVKGHLPTVLEYNLENSPSILPTQTIKPSRLVLSLESPETAMLEQLRERDEIERPHVLNEIVSAEEDSKEESAEVVTLINKANAAHHSIRICGQLLRNLYGTMKGERQVEIIRECYSLTLRMLFILYDHLEKDKDIIAQSVADIIQRRYPKIVYEDLDKDVRRSLNTIALTIAYGLVKHTAQALGLADLKPSYDKYISSSEPGTITISHRLLDLSTRLECYFIDFPEGETKAVAKDLEGKVVGFEVLRIIVWEHFKLFKREMQMRQRLCSLLSIEANQAQMITAPRKLIGNVK